MKRLILNICVFGYLVNFSFADDAHFIYPGWSKTRIMYGFDTADLNQDDISDIAGYYINGNVAISELKYQMAIDSYIGFKKRYTTIMYTYDFSTHFTTNNNTGTFNTYNVDVANSGDSIANVTINSWNGVD